MSYIDGYVLIVPKKNLASYRKMAQTFGRVARDHGCVQYVECVSDDLKVRWGLSFSKLAKPKATEVIVFAFVVYKSKAHRTKATKAIMSDKRLEKMKDMPMPFDGKKMWWGGFKSIVDL